jgi:dTDP-glucose 4,6-dehydratase
MSLKGKNVLVTGAGGFIGSHLVEQLVQQEAKVRCFVRYTADKDIGNLALLPEKTSRALDIVFGDIRDYQAIEKAMENIRIVFHLAAAISIPYSIYHPMEVFQVNAVGTSNILEAARTKMKHIQRVVVTSTSEVYGSAIKSPMDELHPKTPQSPYAASKLAADALAQSYHKSYGLPVVILRPFNTFGPRQSDRAVIPTIISQFLWKDQIKLGDARPKRDFTFVLDTVQAFLLAAEAKAAVGATIHLGTGQTVSIKDVVTMVQNNMAVKKPIRFDKSRVRPKNSEVTKLISDPRYARKMLGWKAKISLEEGIRRTIDWIRSHPENYHPDEYRT